MKIIVTCLVIIMSLVLFNYNENNRFFSSAVVSTTINDIYSIKRYNDPDILGFSGNITDDAVKNIKTSYNEKKFSYLHITSNGGTVYASKQLTEFIKNKSIGVIITGICASACVDVFLDSPQRYAGKHSLLLLHNMSFVGDKGQTYTSNDVMKIGEYYAESTVESYQLYTRNNIPERVVSEALKKFGDEYVQITFQCMLEYGMLSGTIDN